MFERSVFGACLDRAELFSRYIGEDGRTHRVPQHTIGRQAEPERSVRNEPRDRDLQWYAYVSRRLRRLQGAMVGNPPISSAAVLEAHEGMLGDRQGKSRGATRLAALCHLTGPGTLIIGRARSRARARYELLDAGLTDADRDLIDRLAIHMAANQAETRKRAADPRITRAIARRQHAWVTLQLKDHELYDNEVAGAAQNAKEIRKLHQSAMVEAAKLLDAACAEWNARRDIR